MVFWIDLKQLKLASAKIESGGVESIERGLRVGAKGPTGEGYELWPNSWLVSGQYIFYKILEWQIYVASNDMQKILAL